MDWTPQERAFLDQMMECHDLSERAVLRVALRHYQLYEIRIANGEKCVWSGDAQRAEDFAGCSAED